MQGDGGEVAPSRVPQKRELLAAADEGLRRGEAGQRQMTGKLRGFYPVELLGLRLRMVRQRPGGGGGHSGDPPEPMLQVRLPGHLDEHAGLLALRCG